MRQGRLHAHIDEINDDQIYVGSTCVPRVALGVAPKAKSAEHSCDHFQSYEWIQAGRLN